MKLYIVAIVLAYCIVLASGTFDCGCGEYLPSEPSYKNEKTPATTVNVVSENENTLKNDAKQEAAQYQQEG